MTSAFESAINEAMAELEKQRKTMVQLTESLNEITGSARSKRRQVSVTVDGRGDITELTFHGQAYRSLPPADLASIIVETIQDAKQAAQEQVWQSIAEAVPEGLEFAQAATGVRDWSDTLGEVMTIPKPLMEMLNAPPESPDIPEIGDFSSLFSRLAASAAGPAPGDGDGDVSDATGKGKGSGRTRAAGD
jgi:DNA-binding protein YbaB